MLLFQDDDKLVYVAIAVVEPSTLEIFQISTDASTIWGCHKTTKNKNCLLISEPKRKPNN